MGTQEVRVTGWKELAKAARKSGDVTLPALLKEAMGSAAKLVEEGARPHIASKSGKLAASLKSTSSVTAGRIKAGSKSVPYAGVIHYGGYHNIHGDPFLTDSMAANEEAGYRKLDEAVETLTDLFGAL